MAVGGLVRQICISLRGASSRQNIVRILSLLQGPQGQICSGVSEPESGLICFLDLGASLSLGLVYGRSLFIRISVVRRHPWKPFHHAADCTEPTHLQALLDSNVVTGLLSQSLLASELV